MKLKLRCKSEAGGRYSRAQKRMKMRMMKKKGSSGPTGRASSRVVLVRGSRWSSAQPVSAPLRPALRLLYSVSPPSGWFSNVLRSAWSNHRARRGDVTGKGCDRGSFYKLLVSLRKKKKKKLQRRRVTFKGKEINRTRCY